MLYLVLILSTACTSGAAKPDQNITATVNADLPTAIDVAWSGDSGATSYVEYGYDGTYGTYAPAHEGADGERTATLLGLKADTLVYFRVLSQVDGVDEWSEGQSIQTGPLPEGLAAVDITVEADASITERFMLLTILQGATLTGGLMVVDHDGAPVWWDSYDEYPPLASHRSLDGTAVLYILGDPAAPEGAEAVRQAFDLSSRQAFSCPGAHHDLVEIPGGTLGVITTDVRKHDGYNVIGDRIVEYDEAGDGHEVWTSWDWQPVDAAVVDDGDPDGVEWTHANGIDYDTDTGNYLLSLYRLVTVLSIDPAAGAAVWELGGTTSSFTLPDDPGFGPQHAPVATADGLYLFDNHNNVGEGSPSRAVKYSLDEATGEAHVEWQWTDPDAVLSTPTLGDVRPISGGYVLTSWGIMGRAAVIGPTGEVLWDLQLDPGAVLGRGDVFQSFYGNEPITPG